MASRSRRRIIAGAVAALAFVGLGCVGGSGSMRADQPSSGGSSTDSYEACTDKSSCCGAQDCHGDPDEGMICSCTGLWDCSLNPRKCEQPLRVPPGEDGSWSCQWSATGYICKGTPSTPPTSSNGWNCREAADGKSYECLLTPPNPTNQPSGTAAWSCTVDNEQDKLVCERTDSGIDGSSESNGDGDDSESGDVTGGSKSCGGAEFEAKTRQVPDILILLDRSSSMSTQQSGLWPIITKAINEVIPAMSAAANFGLMAFPGGDGANGCSMGGGGGFGGGGIGCAVPQAPLVNVGSGSASQIQSTLANLATCSGTPTAPSLGSALTYLKGLSGDRPKYVLLATDGAPNCNASLNAYNCTSSLGGGMGGFGSGSAETCLDDQRTYQAVDALAAAGIKTYVLGMGEALTFSSVLSEMARRGGTGNYYSANNPTAIKDALSKIAKTIALCEFHVSCGKIPNPSNVSFYFDGNVVARSTSRTSGWDWTDACTNSADSATVQFFGAQCDAIMNNTAGKITANFCP